MKKLILIVCLSFSCNAKADYLLSTAIAFHAVDWMQTIEITKHETIQETNYFLGRKPTQNEVHVYMASTLIINTAIYKMLPRKQAKIFATGWLFIGAVYAVNNHSIGLRIKF